MIATGGLALAFLAYYVTMQQTHERKRTNDNNNGDQCAGGQQIPYAWTGGMDPALYEFLECWAAAGGTPEAWYACKEKVHTRDNSLEIIETDLYGNEGDRYCDGPCGAFERRMAEMYEYWTKGGGRERALRAVTTGAAKRQALLRTGL